MRRLPLTGMAGVLCLAVTSGCALTDMRRNPKARYQTAHIRAAQELQAAGCDLRPFREHYDLEVFYRFRSDTETREELYDFLKVSTKPGPERFVVAYDMNTGRTHLRADLRSHNDLPALPRAGVQSDTLPAE